MLSVKCTCIILFIMINTTVHAFDNQMFCSDFRKRENYTFYPLRHCQRSNVTQISVKNVNSFERCAEFAKSVKALALNYGRFNATNEKQSKNLYELDALKKKQKEQNYTIFTTEVIQDIDLYNCEALSCPETANFSTMINDTRFDYYSLYANPPPPDNVTCIPSIGIFIYSEDHLNFTSALAKCATMGGTLAHVLSDRRTNAFSQMIYEKSIDIPTSNLINGAPTVAPPNGTTAIPPLRLRHAWVGLHEENVTGNFFTTTEKEPIECFLFRAWHPGHPNIIGHLAGVGITDERSWKVFDNRKIMPFICEIYSSGPNQRVSLKQKCSINRSMNYWDKHY